MNSITGVVTLVQEGRFHVLGDDGRQKLFILSRKAPLEPQDLPPLLETQARVTVRYSDSESLIAGIAHDIGYAEDRGESR